MSPRLAGRARRRARSAARGQVILALDGWRPGAGHEVPWVIRDGLSGESPRARGLSSGREAASAPPAREVAAAAAVPARGVASGGQQSPRHAVATAVPDGPHQRGPFQSPEEAALPVHGADRRAKAALEEQVRGVRPLGRAREGRAAPEAEAMRGYCLAVRRALTDDGRPPLAAPGPRLHARRAAIHTPIGRVAEQGGGGPAN